jgi:hypothetical protein
VTLGCDLVLLKLKPLLRPCVEQVVGDTFACSTFALIRSLITRADNPSHFFWRICPERQIYGIEKEADGR